jgi:hypothetical protein
MDDSGRRSNTGHRPRDYSQLPEQAVLDDILYFQERLLSVGEDHGRYSQTRREVYLTLLRQRRQLLTAIRAGRPRDWPVFVAA